MCVRCGDSCCVDSCSVFLDGTFYLDLVRGTEIDGGVECSGKIWESKNEDGLGETPACNDEGYNGSQLDIRLECR